MIQRIVNSLILFILLSAQLYAEISVINQTPEIQQGNTFWFTITSNKEIENIRCYTLGQYWHVYTEKVDSGNVYTVLGGVKPLQQPGKYTAYFKGTDESGTVYRAQNQINVIKVEFARQSIVLREPSKQKLVTSPSLSSENSILGSAFKKRSPQRLFSDILLQPADGIISSPYGAYRTYLSGKTAWWHKGVDIANQEGSKIISPADGFVAISETMHVHGITLVIDHGLGVQTVYNHLSKSLVHAGDEVKRGEVIGLMGETGLATGSHLHWGLSVNGVRVNPMQWTTQGFVNLAD